MLYASERISGRIKIDNGRTAIGFVSMPIISITHCGNKPFCKVNKYSGNPEHIQYLQVLFTKGMCSGIPQVSSMQNSPCSRSDRSV